MGAVFFLSFFFLPSLFFFFFPWRLKHELNVISAVVCARCAIIRQVVVVSHKFEGVRILERHRMVNAALRVELTETVHALSITAKTPEQWERDAISTPSPPCLGGSKR